MGAWRDVVVGLETEDSRPTIVERALGEGPAQIVSSQGHGSLPIFPIA